MTLPRTRSTTLRTSPAHAAPRTTALNPFGRLRHALEGRSLWNHHTTALRLPAPVFIYHAISSHEPHSDDVYSVSAEQFARHLQTLAQAGLAAAALSNVIDAASADRHPGANNTTNNAIALTFDDGCKSWLDVVAPMLIERDWPATFFVIADLGDLDRGTSAVAEPLTAADIQVLSELRGAHGSRLFTIGSHTLNHTNLPEKLSRHGPKVVAAELRDARHRIEDMTGLPCNQLAIPGGKCGDAKARKTIRALANDSGYTLVRDSQPIYHRDAATDYVGGSPVYRTTTPQMIAFEALRLRRRGRMANWITALNWFRLRSSGHWIEHADVGDTA